jgi:hypothetical protein
MQKSPNRPGTKMHFAANRCKVTKTGFFPLLPLARAFGRMVYACTIWQLCVSFHGVTNA